VHGEEIPFGYGFWSLVVVNAAIFVLFALSSALFALQGGGRLFNKRLQDAVNTLLEIAVMFLKNRTALIRAESILMGRAQIFQPVT